MALFSAIAVSCEVDEVTDAPAADALVHKVFHATIEEDGLTKTMLDETAVDGVRGMLWDPGDVIGIGIQGNTFRKFTNVVTEPTVNGVFEGNINEVNTYYAIYPWQENKTMTTELTVDIPSRQTYRANSFDINMAPMVGKGNNGESIHFQNLCGILAISMKGTDVIKSISLTAKDAKGNKALISGQFSVDMGYETFPYPMPTEQSLTNVAIDCGEGVQLDSEKETYFHILLPPGTYYGLDLLITTADARFMTLSTDKTLTVKRSVLTKTSSLEFMENVGEEMITDLSLRGNSNCYIVPSEGIYSFDATVIGNGEFGIIPGAGFHTDIPEITPASVELLWEDRAGLIQGYVYDPSEGRVKLVVSATEGNALIAAKDANGTILWSWHIWVTDTPVDQKYVNSAGTFTVQDRNLGATRADRGTGDEWKDAKGILYEWGRKDPFVFDGDGKHLGTRNSNRVTIDKAIADPMMFAGDYWGWETTQTNTSLWLPDLKTIYDPCPVGYKVIKKEVWQDFSTTNQDVTNNTSEFNVSGAHNNGWDFYYDGINTTYIPATDIINYYYEFTHRDNIADLWSSNATQGTNAYRWNYEYWDESRCRIQMWYSEITSHAMATRCMKDEGHVDVSTYIEVASPDISDVTTNSAMISSATKYGSSINVTDKGFIYGTMSDLSDGNRISCGAGLGVFTYELTDLTSTTRYYVKSYVEFGDEICYSDVSKFTTKYSGDAVDLSADGTANCYIVPFAGQFTFNSLYKGNSFESVGEPTSAEVVWETTNTTNSISQGDVITSVEFLNSGLVLFETSGIEGNALIAVKDVDGVILWSWHIWITDTPQDQYYTNSNGDFHVLDRNLGATRADRGSGDEWNESSGLLYQWGRKDPFADGHYEWVSSKFTIEESIRKPTIYAARNFPWTSEWNDNLWSSQKTVYDPCPVGYKIVSKDIWTGFTTTGESVTSRDEINALGEFDHGWYFYIDGSNTAWYPASPHIGYNGPYEYHSDGGSVWCNTPFNIYTFGASNAQFDTAIQYEAVPARCMRE